jgi:crossover junction endodeoxyribonuclease RusA
VSTEIVATFAIQGEPVSKARARFTGYGSKARAYTPAKVTDAEKAVAAAFLAAGGRFDPDNQTAFGVDVTFHNGTRQRRDVDNMIKLILDGLNGVAWVDDTQVLDIVGRKRFTSREDARTEITVYRTGILDRLTATCEWCKGEFPTWESHKDKVRFCSAACRSESRLAARARICEHCGANFLAHGKSESRRFCSRACHSASGKTVIPCKVCGSDFDQFKSWVDQRPYCSPECVKENNRVKAATRRRDKARRSAS